VKLYVVGEEIDVSPGARRARVHRWDGSAITASPLFTLDESQCRAMAFLEGTLYLFGLETAGQARGALYGYDGTRWTRLVEIANNAAVSLAPFGGQLYLGMQGRGEVWRWDGARLERVHTLLLDAAAGGYTAPILAMTAWDGALWVGRWDATLKAGLERFDGANWSLPHYGGPSQSSAVRALAVYADQLHLGLDTTAVPHAVQRVAPASYRPTATLETPVQDAGLPDAVKALRSLDLAHAPLAAGESIQAQYRLEDSGPWQTLGTSDAVASTGATFTFPAGTAGTRFALRLLLAGPGSSTPALQRAVLRYLVASPAAGSAAARRVWTMDLRLEGTSELPQVLRDGTPDGRSGDAKSAELWALKATPGPLTFVDLDGAARAVWLTRYEERLADASQRLGRALLGTIELVEA
jgi:hypothetical protein